MGQSKYTIVLFVFLAFILPVLGEDTNEVIFCVVTNVDDVVRSPEQVVRSVDHVFENKLGPASGLSKRMRKTLNDPQSYSVYREHIDRWLGSGVTNWPGVLLLNEMLGNSSSNITSYMDSKGPVLPEIAAYIALVNQLPSEDKSVAINPNMAINYCVNAQIISADVTTSGIRIAYELQNNTDKNLWVLHPQEDWHFFKFTRSDGVRCPRPKLGFTLHEYSWLSLYPG